MWLVLCLVPPPDERSTHSETHREGRRESGRQTGYLRVCKREKRRERWRQRKSHTMCSLCSFQVESKSEENRGRESEQEKKR